MVSCPSTACIPRGLAWPIAACRAVRGILATSRAGLCEAGWIWSLGRCDTSPRTWWLKTTELYSLLVLEARSSKSMFPPGALGENPFFAASSFWWLPAFLSLWLHPSSLCLRGHMVSSLSLCVCFIRMHVITFRTHRIIQDNLLLSRSLI